MITFFRNRNISIKHMFELYPDILVKMPSGGLSREEYGNYTAPDGSSAEHCICRAVRNGSGQTVNLEGGQEYRYDYVVYMPVGTVPLKHGTRVEVYSADGGRTVAKGSVRGFVCSPLGCKMWP